MRLWGQVARGLLWACAAFFAVLAVVWPEQRREAILAIVVIVAAALAGVPAIVRLFSSFTGDEEILERGTPGTATITSLTPTRLRFNRYYPVFKFGLDVQASGAYTVQIKQAVDPDLLEQLAPGAVVGVRADPSNRLRVVIDWREPIRPGAGMVAPSPTEASSSRASTPPAPSGRKSAWRFLRWACLLFGLIFLRLGCEAGSYETGGVRVQGVVLEKTYSPGTPATGGRRRSPSRRYVTYRFTTTEGRTLEGRAEVLPGTYQRLSVGGPVDVEYLPEAPETSRIPGQRAGATTWRIMAGVLLTASAMLFLRQKWKWRPRPT